MRGGVAAAPADAADRVDFATEHGSRQRASRCGQGRKALPTIARRVVFVNFVGRRPALDETADDIELAV